MKKLLLLFLALGAFTLQAGTTTHTIAVATESSTTNARFAGEISGQSLIITNDASVLGSTIISGDLTVSGSITNAQATAYAEAWSYTTNGFDHTVGTDYVYIGWTNDQTTSYSGGTVITTNADNDFVIGSTGGGLYSVYGLLSF